MYDEYGNEIEGMSLAGALGLAVLTGLACYGTYKLGEKIGQKASSFGEKLIHDALTKKVSHS